MRGAILERRAQERTAEIYIPPASRFPASELHDSMSKLFREHEERGSELRIKDVKEIIVENIRSRTSVGVNVFFAIGPLTSEGMENKPRNWARLHVATLYLQGVPVYLGQGKTSANGQVFSTTIFPMEMENRLAATNTQKDFGDLWATVATEAVGGLLVTRKDFRKSKGCMVEVNASNAAGNPVHRIYVNEHFDITVDWISGAVHPLDVVRHPIEVVHELIRLVRHSAAPQLLRDTDAIKHATVPEMMEMVRQLHKGQ